MIALVPPSRFMAWTQPYCRIFAATYSTPHPKESAYLPSTITIMVSNFSLCPRTARGSSPFHVVSMIVPSMIIAGWNSQASLVPSPSSDAESMMYILLSVRSSKRLLSSIRRDPNTSPLHTARPEISPPLPTPSGSMNALPVMARTPPFASQILPAVWPITPSVSAGHRLKRLVSLQIARIPRDWFSESQTRISTMPSLALTAKT